MCIALPMQVVATGPFSATCEWRGERREVDTLLVSDGLQPGDWLLVFHDAAREKISAARAEQVSLALTALDMAMHGGADGPLDDAQIDALFPDIPRAESHNRSSS